MKFLKKLFSGDDEASAKKYVRFEVLQKLLDEAELPKNFLPQSWQTQDW